jgi:hypothetical protein
MIIYGTCSEPRLDMSELRTFQQQLLACHRRGQKLFPAELALIMAHPIQDPSLLSLGSGLGFITRGPA